MANGEEAAAGLWQSASSGGFTLTPDAAHELAGHYQWFAEEMAKRRLEVKGLQKLSGFGGFDSARALQAGFEAQAVQAFDAYKAAEVSAYKMKAAILKAANLIEEVDAANAAALDATAREITE